VGEASLASGSLITARQAAEQGREVFAVPGTIHSPVSKGCHLLIKQGAKLVDDANDILVELQWHNAAGKSDSSIFLDGRKELSDAEPILKAMGYDPVSIDALVERVDLPAEQVMVRLAELEIEGAIAAMPGGKYQRLF
jgi:DNA processing protein